MGGERYAVDVKLPGIEKGDQAAPDRRVNLVGLDVTWLISTEPKKASTKVLLVRPRPTSKNFKEGRHAFNMANVTKNGSGIST